MCCSEIYLAIQNDHHMKLVSVLRQKAAVLLVKVSSEYLINPSIQKLHFCRFGRTHFKYNFFMNSIGSNSLITPSSIHVFYFVSFFKQLNYHFFK